LAKQNEYKINQKNTVTMLFQKGGKPENDDYIKLEDKLEMVSSFKYLGITVQATGFTYTHINDRASVAIRAMEDIKNICLRSSNTTMKLFSAKIMLTKTHMGTLKHETPTCRRRCKNHLYLESNWPIQTYGVTTGI
jgi:hypothetical protein